MKILDPMPEEIRNEIKGNIRDHTEILREIFKTSTGQARQYLLFTNAGAAVALMAFMGASQQVRTAPVAWISLSLFFIGLIATGVLTAIDYHSTKANFELWVASSNDFFANNIDIDTLYKGFNSQTKKIGTRSLIAGYAAFLCFILGGALSGGSFLFSSIYPTQGPSSVTGTAPWCNLDINSKRLLCRYYSKQDCNLSTGGSLCVRHPN